jgi:hypothetical protein
MNDTACVMHRETFRAISTSERLLAKNHKENSVVKAMEKITKVAREKVKQITLSKPHYVHI